MKQYFLLFFFSLISYGKAGFFSNDGGVVRLSNNGSEDFNTQAWNKNYGITHSLWLKGGFAHTDKGINGNICSASLSYRVYKQGEIAGQFVNINLPFISVNSFDIISDGGDVVSTNSIDQKWGNIEQNINISALAISSGTRVLEVFFSAMGSYTSTRNCGDSIFYHNNGSNYRLFFNVEVEYFCYASAVYLRTCESPNFPYESFNISGDANNQIGLVNFNNHNFGSFFQNSGEFSLQGGELKTSKENSANVCEPILRFRVYPVLSPSGAFLTKEIDFFENCVNCPGTFPSGGSCNSFSDCNDQKWKTIDTNIGQDLTSDLIPGDYILEIYFELPGSNSNNLICTDSSYINNEGNNFKATFTIIPVTSEIISNP